MRHAFERDDATNGGGLPAKSRCQSWCESTTTAGAPGRSCSDDSVVRWPEARAARRRTKRSRRRRSTARDRQRRQVERHRAGRRDRRQAFGSRRHVDRVRRGRRRHRSPPRSCRSATSRSATRVWQWPQQHGVDDAEHRCRWRRCPGRRQHAGQREAWPLREAARGVRSGPRQRSTSRCRARRGTRP